MSDETVKRIGVNLDTKTLAVGQEVWMQSGIYAKKAKVVEVTKRRVIVELLRAEGPIGLKYQIRFDANRKACDSSDIYDGNIWGGPDPRIPGTHEFGPWELVDPDPHWCADPTCPLPKDFKHVHTND
ncbi:MAG TPA: hypothetical protein VFO39_02135 [Candidatus Sulfotelmatobacter sp.]|nr:hypothetical protein [Candidatus Sulfotelmatobacter sp.]